MQVAGIDIGTTTISAVVLDLDKHIVLDTRTMPNGSFIQTDDPQERIQDADRLVEKAINILDEFLASYPGIRALGLTGQMHGILYVDKDGRAVSPLFTWQDQRGNLPDEEGKTLSERILEETGIQASSGFGLVTHLYQTRKGAVPKGAVGLCTIPDYLGMVLTGRKKPLLHVSMAASLGFYDSLNKNYLTQSYEQLGGDASFFPEVTGAFGTLGTYKGLPITVAIGDNQASFLGSVGFKEDTILLNVGTGGQISVLSKDFFEGKGIEARPLTEDLFILVGASLCGGRAYALLERFFRSYLATAGFEAKPQFEVLNALAAGYQKPEDALKADTRFQGTRSEPHLRGKIENIGEDNFTPEALSYAFQEGIARELYDLFDVIQEGTKIRAKKLVGSGNGLRKNKVLAGIFEKLFGAELVLAQYQEEAACGAAISSSMRTGEEL